VEALFKKYIVLLCATGILILSIMPCNTAFSTVEVLSSMTLYLIL